MGFHGSGMATQAVDLVSGAASNVAASAVSRAYEACHTRQAPTCLTSDKAFYVNGVPLDFPIGGFSPPEGRLARGFKPPAFSRFLFPSAVKSAESF